MAILKKEIAKELSDMMKTSITIQNSIHLADRKKVPGIGFYEDENQYFDPNNFAIHLGIYGPLVHFEVETEEDYVAALNYFYGHENQHVRSTANVPYDNGVKRATQAIIEYIAMKEGIRKNFRNERDYEVFLSTDLKAKGIYVSYRTLMQICAHLMNSVEDGRIERIRSLEFPGFERQRRYFRAIVWNQDMEYKPYKDMEAGDKLNLMMSQILSLATTGLYTKGFIPMYGKTDILDEVRAFMPYVAKGVLAKRTREMADNVVEIAKKLAPYIYDACKMNQQEAESMFEKMLAQLLSQLISQMDPSQLAPTSEREEEQDEGIPLSVFPQSDLVITLPDDVYDKLMEKSKESGKNQGGGLMVRREHPKEEDNESSEDGKGSGSGSKGKDDQEKKEGQGSSSGNSNDSQDKNGSSDGSGSQQDENGQPGQDGNGENSTSPSNQSGQDANGSSQSKSQAGSQSDAKEYSLGDDRSGQNNTSEQGSHSAGGGREGTEEMVKQQMAEAAKECRYDASEKITNINQSAQHTSNTNRGNAPVLENSDKEVTQKDVADVCSRGFKETRRTYQLDKQLPPMLNRRAKTFRKRNERYFKSLSTPNVTYLDSGLVDPSRIYGLAMGETDIFRKKGIDRKFDGCVYVLVDNSGSMSGNKRLEACKAAAVIEEGFKGIIPMKIVAFDTCGHIVHEVIKGWDESQKLNCCWNFANHGRNGCGNDDNQDIMVAQRELLSRPEEKKLLIVLSDGAPADTTATRIAIENTRKKGIKVFGIYFEEGQIGRDAKTFKDMYQKDYVCCELNQVDEHLTKLMIQFSRS